MFFMFFVENHIKDCVFSMFLGFQANPPEINMFLLISGGLA
jgi:hypothetical protein